MSRRSAGRRQKASHIAAKIARGMVYLSRDPAHASLLPPDAGSTIERFALAAGILRPWMIRLMERPGYQRWFDGLMERLWPGELMHFTLRKRFMEDEVRDALATGATQVLVLGAGFDTLGMRMAKAYPNANVVEIEAPATAARRREAFAAIGEAHANLHTLGADLAVESLHEVLERSGVWREDATSVATAEGFLMYLGEAEVVRFLADLRANVGPASRLVFTYLGADAKGKPYMGGGTRLIRGILRLLNEALRWGVRDAPHLADVLERGGFSLLGPPERFHLARRYLAPLGRTEPVGELEHFAVARALPPL